jgi:hypothetical protein
MNSPSGLEFAIRQTVVLDLPLPERIRIARPEHVILKIGSKYYDIGACCYAIRSAKPRNRGGAREVVENSLLAPRRNQILQAIKFLSYLRADSGLSFLTICSYGSSLKLFLDWADPNGLHDCLAGGDSSRQAFESFCAEYYERFRRHEIGPIQYNATVKYVRSLVEGITGLDGLARFSRKIKGYRKNRESSTEPAQPHDFAHVMALNQALFDGLASLVMDNQPFPYRLDLPKSLGWAECHLWAFPLRMWSLPPHRRCAEREKLTTTHWAYDFEHGRLATAEELIVRYTNSHPRYGDMFKRHAAVRAVKLAGNFIDGANADSRHWARIMLAMLAHNAFLFLFFANTGCNEAVAREIETDGKLDATTLNQNFRSIKYRAQGNPISLETPVTFLPTLRRFIELRRWLLNGATFPYLFLTLGHHNSGKPSQIRDASLEKPYNALLRLDPHLPHMGSRKIRATVADYYQRQHDAFVTAKILQNSPETVLRNYSAGSPVEHRIEMSLFLEKVGEMSSKQRIEIDGTSLANGRPLEEGGRCLDYGHPEAMDDGLPIAPDCKQGQGCLFCRHRVLIADEEDARKVASAAFVMEQVIVGPLHEAELRPLIQKCDDDLNKIAAFPGCQEMVTRVKLDVFERGNLTPFFADKFQLFLELGVIA